MTKRPEIDLGVSAMALLDEERFLRVEELGERVSFLDRRPADDC